MRLLIGTHTGLYEARLDFDCESVSLTTINYGYYYGIAVWDNSFIAARRVLALSKDSPTIFEEYDNDLNFLGIPPIDGTDIIDCHQITAAPKGLYITNSARRELIYFDPTLSEKRSLVFSPDPAIDYRINSVTVRGDDVYVCRHNRDIMPSEVHHLHHNKWEEWIVVNRYPLLDYGCHNIELIGDWLFYNNSDHGTLKGIDLCSIDTENWDEKGKIHLSDIEVEPGRHTKGMALWNKYLIVGVSDNTDTTGRFRSDSYVVFVDMEASRPAFRFNLTQSDEAPVGNINEIRVVPNENHN